MSAARPKHITASRSRATLTVEWDDGHRSDYPLAGLRAACPCAECRGGHEAMGVPASPDMLRQPLREGQSADLSGIERVGTYALQLVWKDGHRFGLYTWEYLRQLCACGEHESR